MITILTTTIHISVPIPFHATREKVYYIRERILSENVYHREAENVYIITS